MEFARHRKRRRRRSADPYGAQAGRAFLTLLMIAGIVYFVSASAAGTWLAEKVVVPVFALFDEYLPEVKSPEAKPAEAAPETQLALNDTKKAVELDVNLPAVACFAVQTGVYASADNAQAQAELLRGAGAAGYVLQDGTRYRVLSEAYASEAEARVRKDQRLAQGQDCTLYTIQTDGASYRVSALEEQLESVSAGFAAIAEAQRALTSASIQFEAGSLDAPGAQSALREIGARLTDDMRLLSEYESMHGALSDILACYRDCSAAIEKAGNTDVSALPVFSSEIKYAQLYVTDRYAGLMDRLAQAGSTPSAAS